MLFVSHVRLYHTQLEISIDQKDASVDSRSSLKPSDGHGITTAFPGWQIGVGCEAALRMVFAGKVDLVVLGSSAAAS